MAMIILTATHSDDTNHQWSFRGETRRNAVSVGKKLSERMGTAFPLSKRLAH